MQTPGDHAKGSDQYTNSHCYDYIYHLFTLFITSSFRTVSLLLSKKFCYFCSFYFSFPHFLKFAIVPYTADIVDILLIFLICTLAIPFMIYAFLAISFVGRMQDYLCAHFFAPNSCCRMQSYSASITASLVLLMVLSTALRRYFPLIVLFSAAAPYKLSIWRFTILDASLIVTVSSKISPSVSVISYNVIASSSRRSSGTVPCCRSGFQRLPVPAGAVLPSPPGLYVPHAFRTDGIPGTNILLIHISLIMSDLDRQICDVLQSVHIARTGNIFLFGLKGCLLDGTSFFFFVSSFGNLSPLIFFLLSSCPSRTLTKWQFLFNSIRDIHETIRSHIW